MDRIHIFDTTLRDGEQSPGFSMNRDEKLRLARQIEELGVDVIEAGFPIASPGDLEAVRAVAAEIEALPRGGSGPRPPGRRRCGAARASNLRPSPACMCFSPPRTCT